MRWLTFEELEALRKSVQPMARAAMRRFKVAAAKKSLTVPREPK
jgi:hypothetical protein